MEQFPVEVNKAPVEMLLRVPGIGVNSAKKIVQARRVSRLDFSGLKKIGVVLKRAQYFLVCDGKTAQGVDINPDKVIRNLVSERCQRELPAAQPEQITFFQEQITREDVMQCLTGQM